MRVLLATADILFEPLVLPDNHILNYPHSLWLGPHSSIDTEYYSYYHLTVVCLIIDQKGPTVGSAKSELMQFKVTLEERKLIEKCAQKQDMTVSEYVRACLLMEMVLDGETKAIKIVASTIGRQAVKALQKRARQLEALGEEPELAK